MRVAGSRTGIERSKTMFDRLVREYDNGRVVLMFTPYLHLDCFDIVRHSGSTVPVQS
jgi:hypothetical protein